MLRKSLDGECENGVSPNDICVNKSDQHKKFVIYRSVVNVDFSVHPVYTKVSLIPDYQRVVFTRSRLTSPSLASSSPRRWSRNTLNQRVCSYDKVSVQDEHHALLVCPKILSVRRRYANTLSINPETVICAQKNLIYES